MTKITEFEAGTGRTVTITAKTLTGVELEISGLGTTTKLGLRDVETLREFFQADRDEELGRWRDPENPEWVAYPTAESDEEGIVVANESTGEGKRYFRDEDEGEKREHPWENPFARTARRYYRVHPEKKPAPWEDAPEGAVWKIISGGRGKHALIWRSRMGDWDVLTPRGDSLKEVDDPLAALIEAGYPDFKEYKSAVEMKES